MDFFTEILPSGGTRIGLIKSFNKGATFGRPTYPAAIATVFGIITPDTQELVRDASILFDVAVDRRTATSTLPGRMYASTALMKSPSRCRGMAATPGPCP